MPRNCGRPVGQPSVSGAAGRVGLVSRTALVRCWGRPPSPWAQWKQCLLLLPPRSVPARLPCDMGSLLGAWALLAPLAIRRGCSLPPSGRAGLCSLQGVAGVWLSGVTCPAQVGLQWGTAGCKWSPEGVGYRVQTALAGFLGLCGVGGSCSCSLVELGLCVW